jgi:hypothetical protein
MVGRIKGGLVPALSSLSIMQVASTGITDMAAYRAFFDMVRFEASWLEGSRMQDNKRR